MCGITGFVDKKGKLSHGEKVALLDGMLKKISHRGSDAYGTHIEGSVAFAHARLAIVDLSPLGHQPMKNRDENIVLSYNGEIYNHKAVRADLEKKYVFRSQSDTETLLYGYQEWGAGVISRFKGMFAFSVYDKRAEKVFLAVDRFSIKPVYYIDTPEWFAWSSELKSLLVVPGVLPELNKDVLAEHLLFRSVAGRETLLGGITKMLPSETITLDCTSGEVVHDSYWDLTASTYAFSGKKSHTETIKELLEKSVSEHMQSDVPIGIQLSGGVDSSLVSALVRKHIPHEQELHSFSIGLAEQEWNEFPYSRQMAKLLGTVHHEIVFTEEEFCSTLPLATYHYDEPINHSHSVPMFMLAKEAALHVKVLMSGEGSDEIFGGYRRYAKIQETIPFTEETVLLSNMFATKKDVTDILGGETSPDLSYRRSLVSRTAGQSRLYQLGAYDLNTYLTPLLLRQDKMGMRSTLENRVPFLDHELVEAAFALPDDEKIERGEAKATLKKVAAEYLPKEIVYRTKVGFSQPIAAWLRNDDLFGRYLEMVIRGNEKRRYFDQKVIERLSLEHKASENDHSAILWALINLELWMKIFLDGEKPEDIWSSLKK